MNVSESFSKVIGVALLFVALVAAFLFLWQVLPPNHVHAQNAGNVGIQPVFQPVFLNQASGASSAILQDVGQGENLLFFCTSGFTGTIDLEWSPTRVAPFLTLRIAAFTLDTGCHQLEQGGYFPNLRSTMTASAGNLSAYYTGLAAPVSSISSGIGSNGPTAPIVCDKTTLSSFPSGGTNGIAITTLQTGQIPVFCGFTITFGGATSGNLNFNWVTPLQLCSSGLGLGSWSLTTTANTLQTLIVPISQRSPSPLTNTVPCITNNTGATALVSISYAEVSGT